MRVDLGVWMMMRFSQLMVAMRWVESGGALFGDGEDVFGVEVLDFGADAGAVAVGVGGKGFGVAGPTADVEPFDGERDGGDVGGFFHDGGVDGKFGEGGVDGVEDFGLLGGAPGVGDFHVAFVGDGEVLF